MSKLGTLLGLISLGRAFSGTPLYQRFLSGVAVVICLTIVTGMVAGALLLGIFYGIYELFILYGLASTPAMIATFALGALTLVVLVLCTMNHLRTLLNLPQLLAQHQHPLATRATDIVQSFVEGLTGSSKPVANTNRRWM